MLMIALAHCLFLFFYEEYTKTNFHQAFIFVPILFIGFGHALNATLNGPIVNKVLANQKLIPRVFSLMKILEGLVLSLGMYINGYIRQSTGSYTGVCALIIFNSILGIGLAKYLQTIEKLKGE